ncbi:unnamed protein product [Medioppia subpectinata]|uniref:Roundabout n=1 Tax=Medioppia subpectinata TaxID=1979941 RepID=A0A7R9PUZ4_9ACAR|nr:unnamed protein product [Medioppia subpectinata]CAG2102104.1 unnamed protein product [Medioppia subpectinata]
MNKEREKTVCRHILQLLGTSDEFKIMPKNVRTAAGETAVMECAPPRGFPEPVISWKRNGEKINTGFGRIRLNGNNLMISEVRPGDEGRYQCIAENVVGVRESPPAILNVQVKPFFIRGPEDVTTLSSEHVEFHCKVGGDPTPTITWRRQDGKMPIGRAQILEDKALKIIHVTPADEGVYICEVENPVGTITSSATLIPKDIRVPVNSVARLDCVATGNPPPSVFWTREGNQVLMFGGKSHGRFSVSSEGTLTISGVRKEDKGYYVCSAVSVVGSSMAKSYLTVSAVADVPPPLIKLGPANQTLPQDTIAMLPCETIGSPQPVVKWLLNGKPIPLYDPRFVVLDSGALQIDGMRERGDLLERIPGHRVAEKSQHNVSPNARSVHFDSGLYTCIASSESGETSWSASLAIESPRNPNIMFHRMPDPSTFPGPPQKPSIVNMTETSVTITWRRLGRAGSSPFIGSTVEYYSPELQTGWKVSATRVAADVYTVHDLQPDSRYVFYVRSENNHGLGPPSPISDEIRTLGSASSQHLPEYDLDEARVRLSSAAIELKDVRAVSSTAVKLYWDIQGSQEFMEGFYVRYRDMSSGPATAQKYNMVTVINSGSSSYVLSDLRKYTRFEFFLVPYYKNVEGKPSNTRTVMTHEDVPTGAPEKLTVKAVNLTAATIEWTPPAPEHRNGNLLGYNIHVLGNGSALHSNITVNSSISAIVLYNLTTGAVYSVRALAFTVVGAGPLSSPVALRMDPNLLASKMDGDGPSANSMDTTYLGGITMTLFYAILGALLLIFGSVVAVVIVMKKRIAWKKTIGAHLTVPLNKNEEIGRGGFNGNAREALWINHGWRPSDKDNNQTKLLANNCGPNSDANGYSSAFVGDGYAAPDYAEVDTHNLSTFYKKDSYQTSVPAPYATTTLINTAGAPKLGSVRDHKSSGSDGSRKSDKPMPFNAEYNDDGAMDHLLNEQAVKSPSDSGSYTTDEYGMPVRKMKTGGHNKHRPPQPLPNHPFRPQAMHMNGTGSHGPKGPGINWNDLIPPPPENPPSECGTPPDTPLLNCNVRQHNPNRMIRVQLPSMAYIHSGGSNSGRSPLISRSYQPSPANSRHSLASPKNTLTRNKKVGDIMSGSADASLLSHQNRTQLPQFLQKLRSLQNQQSMEKHYESSNVTNIIANPMDRQMQSSLPSLMDESQHQPQQQQQMRNAVNVGSYQRLEMDGDTDCLRRDIMNARMAAAAAAVGNGRHSPQSSIGGDTDYGHCDREASDGAASHPSSDGEGGGGGGRDGPYDREQAFYAQTDLADCMARAVQNAGGFTFNEQLFSIEPQLTNNSNNNSNSNINKKYRSHQRAQMANNFRPTNGGEVRSVGGFKAASVPSLAYVLGRSTSLYSPSYEMIGSDFNNHLQQHQQKPTIVPNNAMHTNPHDMSSNYFSYNKPIFQETNKSQIVSTDTNKSQLSSPTSSKDSFNLRSFAMRLDARDVDANSLEERNVV